MLMEKKLHFQRNNHSVVIWCSFLWWGSTVPSGLSLPLIGLVAGMDHLKKKEINKELINLLFNTLATLNTLLKEPNRKTKQKHKKNPNRLLLYNLKTLLLMLDKKHFRRGNARSICIFLKLYTHSLDKKQPKGYTP